MIAPVVLPLTFDAFISVVNISPCEHSLLLVTIFSLSTCQLMLQDHYEVIIDLCCWNRVPINVLVARLLTLAHAPG